jgi:hypothetical protein
MRWLLVLGWLWRGIRAFWLIGGLVELTGKGSSGGGIVQLVVWWLDLWVGDEAQRCGSVGLLEC